MDKIAPTELVHVIVTTDPDNPSDGLLNKVWVVFRGKIHSGRWRLVNPSGRLADVYETNGNSSLLVTALWVRVERGERESFTITYGDLARLGWGIKW